MISIKPDKKRAEGYIPRSIEGVEEDFIYSKALKNKKNVLIYGPTGSGKTLSAERFAYLNGLNFYTIPCNSALEPSQLVGRLTISNENKIKWEDGPVTSIVRNGGVLVFNEINFLSRGISEILFSLLDHRRFLVLLDNDGEVVEAHENLLIIADMNEDYLGTFELNEALRDRFSIKLIFDYDSAIEKKLVKSETLISIANNIRKMSTASLANRISTPTSTRALVEFEENVENYNLNFAVYNFVNQYLSHERDGISLAFEMHLENLELDYGIRAR